MTYSVKDVLKMEVAPALGCTEPVAIALASAAATSLLPREAIDSLEVWVTPNIYKNGLAVLIPGTPELSGLDLAAALGVFGGDPTLGLEVLESLDDEKVELAGAFIREPGVKVNILSGNEGLRIQARVKGGGHVGEAVIERTHNNLTALSLDGNPVTDSPLLAGSSGEGRPERADFDKWVKSLSLERLLELVDDLDQEDIDFLKQSVELNMRLAEYGLKHGPALGIGKTLQRLVRQKLLKEDMVLAARMLTSAASDARMGGVKLPAMSSAGSGNHGLTAVLPIWAVRDYIACDLDTIYKAIGFSHLVTSYVKAHTGRLSALCGCSIAAGAGATAAITYLLGGDLNHIAGAIKNLMEDLAGVICDGAKAGCSLKLATAAGHAVQSALFALQGVSVEATDGIIAGTMEQTTQNLGQLSAYGMVEADRTILKIMMEKHIHA